MPWLFTVRDVPCQLRQYHELARSHVRAPAMSGRYEEVHEKKQRINSASVDQ
jgi:hypothetical protein